MMDLLNEPLTRIAKFVISGRLELGEIPVKRRQQIEGEIARLQGTVELEHDQVADQPKAVATKSKSTKKRRKKSAIKKP